MNAWSGVLEAYITCKTWTKNNVPLKAVEVFGNILEDV